MTINLLLAQVIPLKSVNMGLAGSVDTLSCMILGLSEYWVKIEARKW